MLKKFVVIKTTILNKDNLRPLFMDSILFIYLIEVNFSNNS